MTSDIKDMIRRANEEIWFRGDVDKIDDYYASDFTWHTPLPGYEPNLQGYKRFARDFQSAFSRAEGSTEQIVVEGDMVAVRWITSARHTGSFMGQQATGRDVQLSGVTLSRMRNGQNVEEWTYPDSLGLLAQIGALPQMAGAGAR